MSRAESNVVRIRKCEGFDNYPECFTTLFVQAASLHTNAEKRTGHIARCAESGLSPAQIEDLMTKHSTGGTHISESQMQEALKRCPNLIDGRKRPRTSTAEPANDDQDEEDDLVMTQNSSTARRTRRRLGSPSPSAASPSHVRQNPFTPSSSARPESDLNQGLDEYITSRNTTLGHRLPSSHNENEIFTTYIDNHTRDNLHMSEDITQKIEQITKKSAELASIKPSQEKCLEKLQIYQRLKDNHAEAVSKFSDKLSQEVHDSFLRAIKSYEQEYSNINARKEKLAAELAALIQQCYREEVDDRRKIIRKQEMWDKMERELATGRRGWEKTSKDLDKLMSVCKAATHQ
ncbi:DNA topoisomerase 2 [Sphaceloma murrayae]|uniref:DNA topoisomerase 2 n=1 Tax=Sphaceloma murrayae TaxID=2082308 RepID=A0A2K1QPR5_9PEZI|nr:DNA topoisomerase 2 [Sphaceloma murrayae]